MSLYRYVDGITSQPMRGNVKIKRKHTVPWNVEEGINVLRIGRISILEFKKLKDAQPRS